MCGKKQCKKHSGTNQQKPPVKSSQQTYRGSNSFSSFKIKVKGKIMSQDTSGRCIQAQKRQNICIFVPKQCPDNQDRGHTFQAVTKQIQGSRLFTQGTHYIGRSQITASLLADICMIDLSHKIRCLEKSAHISNQ